MSTPVFTLANQLTILRMALSPLLVVLVLDRRMAWALAAFVVAGLTDLLDGVIARHSRQQTTLGAMLDPVADKILITSTFVALTWASGLEVRIPTWLTVRVIDATTGEILVSAKGIGVSKKGGGFAFAKGGTSFGTNTTDFRESAIGEAQAMACAEVVKAIVLKKDRLE